MERFIRFVRKEREREMMEGGKERINEEESHWRGRERESER